MQNDVKTNVSPGKKISKPQIRPTSIDEEISNRRKIIVYALVFILLTGICSYFLAIVIVPGEIAIRSVAPSAITFLLLGVLFCILLTTKLSYFYQPGSGLAFVYLGAVFLLVLAAIVAGQYAKGNWQLLAALFYGCLALLTFTIQQSWLCYKMFSKPQFLKIFYLPPPGTTSVATTVFLNSIPVKIRLSPMAGAPESLYDAVIPGRMTIGEMFSFFINDKQETGEQPDGFPDIVQNNYGWQFFTTTYAGLGLRQLNPEESLIENGIKENATIIIRRVQNQLPQEATNDNSI